MREADLAIDCVPDELESKLEILVAARPHGAAAHRAGDAHYPALDRRPGGLHLSRRTSASPLRPKRANWRKGTARKFVLRSNAEDQRTKRWPWWENFWRRLGIAPRFEVEAELRTGCLSSPAQTANQPAFPSTDS